MANSKKKGTGIIDIGERLLSDLSSEDLKRGMGSDIRDLRDFYLDEDQITRLEKMGHFKKGLVTLGWILKELIMKLTPLRRILLVIGLLLIFRSFWSGGFYYVYPGSIVLLFLLMLELRDKLIASNELEGGRAVQEALMPAEKPDIPGWDVWLYTRPANHVGGDLIDFIPFENKHYGIVLGDVSGKGLTAALLMAKLQSTLRALAHEFDNLGSLAAKINRIFYRDSMPWVFASMVYIDLDLPSGKVKLVNAGHLPPVICRGEKNTRMNKGAAALGVRADIQYNEESIEIEQGDILLVYSDGLSEAEDPGGDFFGDENIMKILAAHSTANAQKIGEQIIAAVENFCGKSRPSDDISILVIKKSKLSISDH